VAAHGGVFACTCTKVPAAGGAGHAGLPTGATSTHTCCEEDFLGAGAPPPGDARQHSTRSTHARVRTTAPHASKLCAGALR
jgi:hypothetical protein